MRRALATAARSTTPLPTRLAQPTSLATTSRPFSSSSSHQFFFRRPTVKPSQIAKDIYQAANDGRPDVVAKLYPSLVDTYKSNPSTSSSSSSPLVSRPKLQFLMRTIAKTNRVNLLLKMFQDLPTVFGFEVTALDHHLLVMGLSNSGKMLRAQRWLDSMEKTHGIKPQIADYNLILNAWRRKQDLYEMRKVVKHMKERHGIEPNVVTYNTFISTMFEKGSIEEVRKLREEMQRVGVEPDVYTETALLAGYVDVGELASAKEVQTRLAPKVMRAAESGIVDSSKYDTAMVNALLKYEAVVHGFDKAVTLTDRYKRGGIPLDLFTVNTLLVEGSKGVRSAEEGVRLIEMVEDLVEIESDKRAWSVTIKGLLEGLGGIDEALKLYQIARDRSIDPDTAMIHPLVNYLFTPSPTPDSFATAKSLYDDLSSSPRTFDSIPEEPIYALLLRACAHPSILDLNYSRTLISDMKTRGIKLEPEIALYSIQALMRASSNYDEAFQAYDEMRALDPSILSDANDYNKILTTFLYLNFPSSSSTPPPSAPPELVMEFIADMRTSQHPANSITYSILLTYYSRTSSASITLIEHLHSLIKLDINLDPDTALFNSLMSAFSHVKAFSQTYRIWESMCANRRAGTTSVGPDQRSLSIVIDTCGWDKSSDAKLRGRRIWNDVESRLGIRKNKKNWDTWVECLCRWREVDEAMEVVFGEMGKEGRPRADRDTLEHLLKFARSVDEDKWEEVRARLGRERPDLFEELKDVGAMSLEEHRNRTKEQ